MGFQLWMVVSMTCVLGFVTSVTKDRIKAMGLPTLSPLTVTLSIIAFISLAMGLIGSFIRIPFY